MIGSVRPVDRGALIQQPHDIIDVANERSIAQLSPQLLDALDSRRIDRIVISSHRRRSNQIRCHEESMPSWTLEVSNAIDRAIGVADPCRILDAGPDTGTKLGLTQEPHDGRSPGLMSDHEYLISNLRLGHRAREGASERVRVMLRSPRRHERMNPTS